MQQQFAIFVLIAWIPITIGLFAAMPSRKATVTSLIGAWLILPSIGIPLPGFPDYTKVTATTFGILISTFLFEFPRLIAFRPRWFDLPILVWCACPFAASISNGDGVYDGLSQSLVVIFMWGLPYLIGRLYFGDQDGMRALATGIIAGGVAYIFPCLWEIRMSPQLSNQVYGLGGWMGTRFGGYRPKVFLLNGLELGMWMSAATLCALWFWRAGTLKRLAGFDFGKVILPLLCITNILCKSTGALILCMCGIICLWGSVRLKTKVLLVCIILATPIYYATRISGFWTGENLSSFFSSWVDEERAWSLEFRFRNENLLIEKALDRPLLGWGGWGRALKVDVIKLRNAKVANRAISDGLWIVALGNRGLIGLSAVTLVILLPAILFLKRFPVQQWSTPNIAPMAVFAVILSLYMIDCIANAMINLIYVVAIGGLNATFPDRRYDHRINDSYSDFLTTSPDFRDESEALPTYRPTTDSITSSKEILAKRHADLARSLAQQGRIDEAKAIWFRSLDLWSGLTSTHPEISRLTSSWCDCCNDLAWFLLNQPTVEPHEISEALDLTIKATETSPTQSAYWNTLGAAYYRAGDDPSAIAALHRSISLQDDRGNGFDFLYLALACSRLQQHDIAQSWYDQGVHWIKTHGDDSRQLQQLCYEAKANLNQFEKSKSGTQ